MLKTPSSQCPLCNADGVHDFSSTDLMFGGNDSFDYHRCRACGLVYQHPMPSNEQIAGFYPDSYIVYCEPTRTEFTPLQRAYLKRHRGYAHLETRPNDDRTVRFMFSDPVAEVIACTENGHVLDIGCGNGEFLLRLKSIGWHCSGVEFNEKAVDICKKHGLDVFHGDLIDAKLPAESFDYITAHHLIEHAPNPHQLMSEITRLLKPGGHLLIRTPNSRALGRGWFGKYWYANDVPRHLFLYSKDNLSALARKHGLMPERVRTVTKPKILLRSLDYKMNNKGKPSKQNKALKWLAKLYVPATKISANGDEIYALYKKA